MNKYLTFINDNFSKQSIDVFIVDQTIIHYYRRVLQNPKLRLVGKEFGNDAYAIALSLNSPLTKRVNLMISRYVEDGSLEETIKLWLEHMPGCSDTQLREVITSYNDFHTSSFSIGDHNLRRR